MTQPRASEATTKDTDTTETCKQGEQGKQGKQGKYGQSSKLLPEGNFGKLVTCSGPKKMHLSCSGLSSFSWWPTREGGEAHTGRRSGSELQMGKKQTTTTSLEGTKTD